MSERTLTRDWKQCDNDEIKCPYCGLEIGDTWDTNRGEPTPIEEISCEECEKNFYWSREYTVEIKTVKSCKLNEEPHDLEHYHENMQKCKKCGEVVYEDGSNE